MAAIFVFCWSGTGAAIFPLVKHAASTQLEYERAAAQMDVLVLLVDENGAWMPKFDERHQDTEVPVWREYLKTHHTVGFFGLAPHSIPIAAAIKGWIEKQNSGSVWTATWLRLHVRRLEADFAANMEAAMESADARYVELRLQRRGKSDEAERAPFSVLARAPGERWLVIGPAGSGKTTSLLRLAADLARRALEDAQAPVPLYARLSSLDKREGTFDRLLDVIALKAELDATTLRTRMQRNSRTLVFLLDGFNEIDSSLQRDYALPALQDLFEDRRHGAIITSRSETPVRALAGFATAELVELDDAQIADFLNRHQADRLSQRLSDELRELCRNPFMLWALADYCADLPDSELPTNPGELHRTFIERYIFAHREERKPRPFTAYHYERVKKPVLARLALDWTRQGVTRCEEITTLQQIAAALTDIQTRLEPLYGLKARETMPEPPVPAEFAAEAVQNGVLRRIEDGFEFMRESVQDCFAALALLKVPVSAVLTEIPAVRWIRRDGEAINESPTPLRNALVMLAGLLTSADELITGLLETDPELAAECLGACRQAGPSTRDAVLHRVAELLRSADPIERYIGSRAVRGAREATPEILEVLTAIVRSGEWARLSEAAAWSLRYLPAEQATQPLLDAFADSPFFFARGFAFMTLAERPGSTLGPDNAYLLLMSTDDTDKIRRSAADLYRRGVPFAELLAIAAADSAENSAAAVLLRFFHSEQAGHELRSAIVHGEPSQRDCMLDLLPMVSIGPTARETLLEVAADPANTLEFAARAGSSLGYLINQMSSGASRREILDILLRRLHDPQIALPARAAAAKAVAMAGSDEDQSGILRLTGDASQDPVVRAAACYSLRPASPLPFSWNPILNALQFFCIRTEIFEALFRATLEDPDHEVRTAAAGSLFWQPLPGERLLEKLTNAEETVVIRANAAEALGTIRVTQAEPALLAIIKTAQNYDHLLAVKSALALGKIASGGLIAVLESLVTDIDEVAVRSMAALALWTAEQAQALDRLTRIALDEQRDPAAHFRVLSALHVLVTMDKSAVDTLLLVTLESHEDEVRADAARFAHHAAPEHTLDVLREALADAAQPAAKREAAAIGLAFIKAPEVEAALERIAEQQADPFAAASAQFARTLAHYCREKNEFPHPKLRLGMRATAHAGAASWVQGLADFTELIAMFSHRGAYRAWRAMCLASLGRHDEALLDTEKAIELAPDDPDVYAMAAARYVQAGRCVEAYRCYLRATQLKPGHADWCFWLSVLAYEMKNVAQAVQHVQEAVQLDPRNGDYQLQLGWLAYVAGELDKSIDASRRAAELLPSQPIASFNAGLALLAKGEATSAIAEYEKALLACSELRPIEAGAAIQAALTDLDNLLETRKDLSSAILDVEFRLRQKIAGHSSISFH